MRGKVIFLILIIVFTDDQSFLVGSHGRDTSKGLNKYEDVFRLDRYCIKW